MSGADIFLLIIIMHELFKKYNWPAYLAVFVIIL